MEASVPWTASMGFTGCGTSTFARSGPAPTGATGTGRLAGRASLSLSLSGAPCAVPVSARGWSFIRCINQLLLPSSPPVWIKAYRRAPEGPPS